MVHELVSVRRASFLLFIALLVTVPMRAQQNDVASLFKSKCAICHGEDGSGNTKMGTQMKAADLRADVVQKLTDQELIGIVTNGKNGKMPAWGEMLKPEQIKDLVGHIRILPSKKSK